VRNTKDKAEILNNQFHATFTREDVSNLPSQQNSPYPAIPDTSFSVDGILQLLNLIDTNKASGPDNIPARVLKLCGPEIAPILAVLFTQSYENRNYQMTGYLQISLQHLRKTIKATR